MFNIVKYQPILTHVFLCPFDPLKTQVFHLTIAEEPHLCRTDDLSRTKAIWGVDSEGLQLLQFAESFGMIK